MQENPTMDKISTFKERRNLAPPVLERGKWWRVLQVGSDQPRSDSQSGVGDRWHLSFVPAP